MQASADTSTGGDRAAGKQGRHREDRDMLHHRETQVAHADLIDLLLDADEPTRNLLLFQIFQNGKMKRAEVEEMLLQVARLERAAGPRSELTQERAAKARARAA
jgi:hypothetical protein